MLRDEGNWREALRDERGFQRVPVAVEAALISSALGRVRVTLTDLSQGGCRVVTRARLHEGQHFVLRVDPIGPRQVTAAWCRDEQVGFAFAQPLAWPVVAAVAFGDRLTDQPNALPDRESAAR